MKIFMFISLLLIALAAAAQDPPAGILNEIGVDQKLDATVPLNLRFRDESGAEVELGSLFRGKPVILSLVYYECPMLCSMTLNGLVKSMRPLTFEPVLTSMSSPSASIRGRRRRSPQRRKQLTSKISTGVELKRGGIFLRARKMRYSD
jgi:hypothetical protein